MLPMLVGILHIHKKASIFDIIKKTIIKNKNNDDVGIKNDCYYCVTKM